MIKSDRGVIFGTAGKSRGQTLARASGQNAAANQANATSQFGRSQARKPVYGGRMSRARR